MRGSPMAVTAVAVPSLEASSTTMISKSCQDWARTLSIARQTVTGRLNTGMTTLTLGVLSRAVRSGWSIGGCLRCGRELGDEPFVGVGEALAEFDPMSPA